MEFVELGRIAFQDAWRRQEESVEKIAAGRQPETVHLLEHPHVFTVGRNGDDANLLAACDWRGDPIDLVRINRGGDVTYHGPGQLVGYPMLDLRKRGRDIHRYLRDLEDVLIRIAADFGVPAFRRPGLTGVWTQRGKLAAIGVGVRRWITMHGFALNVNPDLRYFQLIHPCGIQDCPVTSLSQLLDRPVDLSEAVPACRRRFSEVFEPASAETGFSELSL